MLAAAIDRAVEARVTIYKPQSVGKSTSMPSTFAKVAAIPTDAVACTIGANPGSPDDDISVRFLSGKEFYND